MNIIRVTKDVLANMRQHARREAPIEACGYLAGSQNTITTIFPLVNIDASPEHFSFDPKEQFAVINEARKQGLELRAVYHSHPATPARPSPEDIRLAQDPEMFYIIVSLTSIPEEIKAFKIINGIVEPQNIEEVSK